MATFDNKFVTNWLAAYCGDEQMLRRAVENLDDQLAAKKGHWPLIDSDSQRSELIHHLFPKSPEKLDSDREQAMTFEGGKLRAVLELTSDRQFTIRGYLTDLSQELAFSKQINNLQSELEIDATEPDTVDKKFPDVFSKGRTPHYATSFPIESDQFVAELSVSDFATFEISGYALNVDEPEWNDDFMKSIQDFLSKLTP